MGEYGRIVEHGQVEALQLAGTRAVQNALRTRDRAALARLRRAHPHAQFLPGHSRPKKAPGTAQRSVEVVVGTKPVGSVVVDVVLNNAVLAKLAGAAGLLANNEIAVAERSGRVVAASGAISTRLPLGEGTLPRTVESGGVSYRAVPSDIAPGTRLAMLEPTGMLDATAIDIRNKILLIGFIVLAAVMLMAYALAPALGRARFAQHQRAVAERALAHVADGVLLLDNHGVVRFWNTAAEQITGLTANRVLGMRAETTIPGWRAAVRQIPVSDAGDLDRNSPSMTFPLELEGRELWLAASGVLFSDGIVYSFRDISEDERLDQAKTDFVATVSHELRTPLASVYGAALTLQRHFDRLDEPQRQRLLNLIAEEADRLSDIIDDILLASRLDSGRLDLESERFDARQVARGVVEGARMRASEGIEFGLSVPDTLPQASGDGDKVRQVLSNLVENAVKYSPGGGRIEVRLEHDGDRIRFEVQDEGLGIPLDEQDRIFKKFYRLDPNLTLGIGGTGLGLYISRELVRRMGGEIHVSSMPGRGSIFEFDLPVARSPDRVAEPVGSA